MPKGKGYPTKKKSSGKSKKMKGMPKMTTPRTRRPSPKKHNPK